MKFEFKTENENYSKSFLDVIKGVFIFTLLIIFCDVSLKLGKISRLYQIEFNCRLLSVEKSASTFKELSKLSNLKSKQVIWDFCRSVIK